MRLEATPLPGERAVRMRLAGESGITTWRAACKALQEDASFRRALRDALREAPFEAYFWECSPVRRTTLDEPFEWVVVESPSLAGVATDERAFSDALDRSLDVRSFPNLGGEALLVAPCRGPELAAYAHLASFLRGAPEEQVDRLLAVVGREVELRLRSSDAPLWVSTSGLGVYWLHVRLDERPKYYTHAPYRHAP